MYELHQLSSGEPIVFDEAEHIAKTIYLWWRQMAAEAGGKLESRRSSEATEAPPDDARRIMKEARTVTDSGWPRGNRRRLRPRPKISRMRSGIRAVGSNAS